MAAVRHHQLHLAARECQADEVLSKALRSIRKNRNDHGAKSSVAMPEVAVLLS